MPSDKIDLKASLEDSPQIQGLVSKLESDIAPMKDCTVLLRDTFQACSVHQQKVCEGTDTLTKLLQSFQEDAVCDDDNFLSGSFRRLGRYLTELHSCQDMLSTQIQSAVIELLSQFISNDFTEIDKLKESFDASWQDHEQATVKYSRVSKKKDSEKNRFEANSDLFMARKKYYDSCLAYYSKLNGFKLKWKYSLMEPLLTYMHAQMAYFKAGHEVLSKELGKVLNELNTDVQRFHSQYQQEMAVMAEEREEIELSFPTFCLPDPDPNDPFTSYRPPKANISSKSGFLFLRVQKSGFISQWDRGYFYTKKGELYSHFPQKPSAEKLVNLKSASASVGDIDDRRYVLQITNSVSKKPIYLMAENDVERDEWIAVVNNSGSEMSSHQANVPGAAKNAHDIKQKRDWIRDWVKNEIQEPPKRNAPKPRSATSSAPGIPLPISRPPPPQPRPPKGKKSSEPSFPTSLSQNPLPTPLQPEKPPAVVHHQTPPVVTDKKFSVKYLGHTEIKDGKAANVITDTIRKVMAARSVQSVKSALDIEMTVSPKSIKFMDLVARKNIGQIQLKGVIRCSTHPVDIKLLGVVNRSISEPEKPRYICHVLESEFEGSKICKVIDDAVQAAMKNPEPMPLPPKTHKRAYTPVSNSNDYPDYSNSGSARQPPRKPPPPRFTPKISSNGYVTLEKDQVIAANTPKPPAPSVDHSVSTASTYNEPLPPSRPRPLPPPPGSNSSNDLLSMDTQGAGKSHNPEHKLGDSFVTEDTDEFDLPPLDSPPPPVMGSRGTDSSYIDDSSFTATPSSSVEPSIMGDDDESTFGYFSQSTNNATSTNDFESSSIWSGVSGQQSTVSDSGYYKGDGGGFSVTSEPQNTTEDFDLFQDTFNDFSTPAPTSTSQSSHATTSQSSFTASSQLLFTSTSQQSFAPASNTSNFGYFTSQGSNTTSTSMSTAQKQQPTSSYSTSTSTAAFPSAPVSSGSNLQTSNTLEGDCDLGEPVDLLSDLSEPFDNGSSFQNNFNTGQSSSKSSGYYHADQTTPLEPMKAGDDMGDGGFSDNDDWLPPLPDENSQSYGT